MTRMYVVKRGRHYNGRIETVHVSETKEGAETYIANHIKQLSPGDHLYIATASAYDPQDLDTSKEQLKED